MQHINSHLTTGKKLLSLAGTGLVAGLLFTTSFGRQGETISGFTLAGCEEDYEDVNFCSTKFVKAYKKAMKSGANFNEKYALTFIPSTHGYREVVAIDTSNRRVTTLGVEINPTSTVEFSKDSDTFCFSGDISGYRQDNSYKKVCYTLEEDPYSDVNPDASGMEFTQSLTEF